MSVLYSHYQLFHQLKAKTNSSISLPSHKKRDSCCKDIAINKVRSEFLSIKVGLTPLFACGKITRGSYENSEISNSHSNNSQASSLLETGATTFNSTTRGPFWYIFTARKKLFPHTPIHLSLSFCRQSPRTDVLYSTSRAIHGLRVRDLSKYIRV